MSLRRRLTLSLFTILILFAANVGTHFWGSFARSESMVAYRSAVTAAQLSSEIEQLMDAQRQQILVLATLRDTTEDQLDSTELTQAEESIETLTQKIQQLGRLTPEAIEVNYQTLWQSGSAMLNGWLDFYRNYNDLQIEHGMNNPLPYLETSQRLKELEQRQSFIAVQRANVIDATIALTDRITIIGFLASIFLTATLGFFLVRYTNTSLQHLKTGTERFGSGDLNYKINDIDDDGELGDLAAAFNDMSSKLRNAILEVREAKDNADRANDAKSSFLANVSHELRTPLNAIIGYSEMLHDELNDEHEVDRPQFQSDLDKIILSGRQLLSLINDILDISKIETGKMALHLEIFEPGEILQQVCDSLVPLVRNRNNRLQLSDANGLPALHSDSAKFRQIFVNLLSNANKFTASGSIQVRAKETPDRSGWLEFSVQDTGIGMSQEQQNRVFDAFVQADSSTSANYGGTGLGLAICREYCELMGGSISVQSEPGVGSTFVIQLPIGPESTLATA